jgi:hypothetical protein
MSTPFITFVGVAITIASVVTLGLSLYYPCKVSLNNFNEKGCMHIFDA